MKYTILYGRSGSRIEREARLCFLNAPNNNNAPQNAITRLEGFADKTANVAQTAAEKAIAFGRDFPVLSTIVKGIYDVSQENIDNQTQENLVDRAAWVDTFQFDASESWLTKQPPVDIDRTRPVTAKVLFHAMTPEQRRTVFFEHVDLLIPEGVRKNMVKDPSFAAPDVRLDVIGEDGLKVYRRAMVGILGMDRIDTPAEKDARAVATAALEKHYATGHFPGTVTRGFDQDYIEALRRNSLTGKEPFATLPQALYEKLPPSGFKGALMLGVIDTSKLRTFNKIFIEHEHDQSVLKGETARKLDEMSGVTKARLRKEAKGIKELWTELGGFEKLALIAAGAYALTSKAGRGLGMLFGGAYFFYKLVLKDKDPLKSWSNNAKKGLIDPVKRTLSPVLGPYDDDKLDPSKRSAIVAPFLDRNDRKNMSEQALGLSILLDVPLDILARNFRPTGPGTFRLNLGSDGTVDDAIGSSPMKRAFNQFVASPNNRDMATEAVANVFYRLATRSPLERGPKEKIELVMNRLPSGSTMLAWSNETLRAPGGASYALLPHRETDSLQQNGPSVPGTEGYPNAHKPIRGVLSQKDLEYAGQQYIRLVQLGKEMATGNGTLLRTFMIEDMDLEKNRWKKELPPGPAKNNPPGPAQNQNPPGPNNAVPPGPANNLPPGPANNVPPGPANNAPPGPVNNVPPGPGVNPAPGPLNPAAPGPAVNPAPGPVLNPPPGPILNPPPGPVVPPAPGPAAPAAPGAAPAPAPGPVAPAAPGPIDPMAPGPAAPAAPGAAPAAAPGPLDPMAPGPVVPPAPGPVDVDPAGPAVNPAPAPVNIDPAGPIANPAPAPVDESAPGAAK